MSRNSLGISATAPVSWLEDGLDDCGGRNRMGIGRSTGPNPTVVLFIRRHLLRCQVAGLVFKGSCLNKKFPTTIQRRWLPTVGIPCYGFGLALCSVRPLADVTSTANAVSNAASYCVSSNSTAYLRTMHTARLALRRVVLAHGIQGRHESIDRCNDYRH